METARINDFEIRYLTGRAGIDTGDLKPGVMWINKDARHIQFLCPCGCDAGRGTILPISIAGDARPPEIAKGGQYWTLIVHNDETISLTPSVLQTACGAHYFVQNNKVRWV